MSQQTKKLRKIIDRLEKLVKEMEESETDLVANLNELYDEETEKPIMGVYI